MTPQAEHARQKAFNEAVSRILRARGRIDAASLEKPASAALDRLAGHLNAVWQACRAGKAGIVEFGAALRDWEEESLGALDSLAVK